MVRSPADTPTQYKHISRHQALPNPEDAGPLKAILAYDALVHPDHPLRLEGKDGIELSIGAHSPSRLPVPKSRNTAIDRSRCTGTLHSGEARLLFSSAQVEYIRYWLHAMGYHKELIPLPYSDALLTASSLQNHAPVIYKTGSELRGAIKVRGPCSHCALQG